MTQLGKYTVVIPARFASTRLPGKALLDIAGKPMIQRVYEQARQSQAADVIIATDDSRIEQVAKDFGARVCMTSPAHESGTDRVQEVAQVLGLTEDDIIVSVQGDEPLIPPAVIDQVANNLAISTQAGAATLSEPISELDDFTNPNMVKVVTAQSGLALYFSRAGIPFARDRRESLAEHRAAGIVPQRHIGIYAYRVSLLNQFVQWPPAKLEQIEKLEQLRILDNGLQIHVAEAQEEVPGGIDTSEDLDAIRQYLLNP